MPHIDYRNKKKKEIRKLKEKGSSIEEGLLNVLVGHVGDLHGSFSSGQSLGQRTRQCCQGYSPTKEIQL
jgi:hypothetical protein